MKDRVLRDFAPEDIRKIADTFHNWRSTVIASEARQSLDDYTDILGFCKSTSLEEIRKHDYVLTPGRYVGAAEEDDDGELFADKMGRLTGQLKGQFEESDRLENEIKKNLAGLGFEL